MRWSWQKSRDAYDGEEAIKCRDGGICYLPPTPGQVLDGMTQYAYVVGRVIPIGSTGYVNYANYLKRAVFHAFLTDAVKSFMGLLWSKPPKIELPAGMEFMRETATPDGESLLALYRRVNQEQLITSRAGLLLDIDTKGEGPPRPYIAMYIAEAIRNWDDGRAGQVQKLNLVILDESEPVRNDDDFCWTYKCKYRILILDQGVYKTGLFEENAPYDPTLLDSPNLLGTVPDQLPFFFINAEDVLSCPKFPVLERLTDLCYTIYRGEADYRQNLFQQGQDTLVTIGVGTASGADSTGDTTHRVGSGAAINIPNINGDAKFIGTSSLGLPEQRSALENDKAQARTMAGQLIDTRTREKESGEAMRIRLGAQTITLLQIAQTAALAFENCLKQCAIWMRLDPTQVKVTPNTDFTTSVMSGVELTALMTAKNLGAPISQESIHKLEQYQGLTDNSFEEELAKIKAETPLVKAPPNVGSPNGSKSSTPAV